MNNYLVSDCFSNAEAETVDSWIRLFSFAWNSLSEHRSELARQSELHLYQCNIQLVCHESGRSVDR